MRTVVDKVIWVGRATIFVVGLAVILALAFGVASTALGATGTYFILGKSNGATTMSKLTANVAGPRPCYLPTPKPVCWPTGTWRLMPVT